MKESLVSIIVPIYNSSSTLSRTLTSIINQNYKLLEIILVNDGSKDNSLEICKYYKKKDNRIKIINQVNSGVSMARNIGLDVSSGEYIVFIDSDDAIDKNFISELVNISKKYDVDIVGSNICVVLQEEQLYPYIRSEDVTFLIDNEIKKSYLEFEISPAIWGKLYKKSLIENIRFLNISIYEDFIFSWEVIKKARIFIQCNSTHYNYFAETSNSLTKTKFTTNNMSIINYANKIIEEVRISNYELTESAYNYLHACTLHNLIIYYEYLKNNCTSTLFIKEKQIMENILNSIDKIKKTLLLQENNINIQNLIQEINIIIKSRMENKI